MEESILISIKLLLGIAADNTDFDTQLIMHINSVFFTLNELGVGPKECFSIEDENAYWEDFIPDMTKYHSVKSYMGMKVRLLFDPPTMSAIMEAMNRQIAEFEFRLNVMAES